MDKFNSLIKFIGDKLSALRIAKKYWISITIVVFLALVIVQAPARLITLLSDENQIYFDGLQGTVWNGSAAISTIRVADEWLSLGRVDWQIHPGQILLGKLKVEVQQDHHLISNNLTLSLKGGRVEISDGTGAIDTKLLRLWLPKTIRVHGNLNTRIKHLGLSPTGEIETIEAEALWDNAALRILSKQYGLSNLILGLSRKESAISVTIGSIGGDSASQWRGTVDYDNEQVQVDIGIKPGDDMEKNLLTFLKEQGGTPDKDGFYNLAFSHKL